MTADDERIAQIQARLEAATPGKWISATDNGRKTGIALVGTVAQRGTGECIAVLGGAGGRRGADADLIANAPADLAFLVARLAERDAEIARLTVERDVKIAARDRMLTELSAEMDEGTELLEAAGDQIERLHAANARMTRAHESAQTTGQDCLTCATHGHSTPGQPHDDLLIELRASAAATADET